IVNLTKIQNSVSDMPAGMEQIQELATLTSGAELDKLAKAKKFGSFTEMLGELTRKDAQKMIEKLKTDAVTEDADEQLNAKRLTRQKNLQGNPKVAKTT
ncbi:unnamed protein product, partial [marine sediment metagenome]